MAVECQCVISCSKIGQLVRDNRSLFLHKGLHHKFKGYAFSQVSKMQAKERRNEKRQKSIDLFGYDTKFAYHVVRLVSEAEQLLKYGDMDLTYNQEEISAVKKGEWSFEDILKWFESKEKHLDVLYEKSSLPYSPEEKRIKQLLINCLEECYGEIEFLKLFCK